MPHAKHYYLQPSIEKDLGLKMHLKHFIFAAIILSTTFEAAAQQCPRTFFIRTDGFPYTYEMRDNGTVVGRDPIRDPRGEGPDTVTMSFEHATQVFQQWNIWTKGRPSQPAPEEGLRWLQCHRRGGDATANAAPESRDLDTVTPQVPGCPRYLRKSFVQWRRNGGNPEGNSWVIKNVSNKVLKVTYREDNINSETATINPGSEEPISLNNGRIPPYVIRDFEEIFNFNRTHSVSKELQLLSLKCNLAIQPR